MREIKAEISTIECYIYQLQLVSFPILQLHSAGFSNPVNNKKHNHNHLVTNSNQFNPDINSLNVKTWIHKLLRIQYLSSLLELISFQQTGCLENTRNAVNENMCVTASSENSWNCNQWILKKPDLSWETNSLAVTGIRMIKLKIPGFGCIFLSLKNGTNIVSYRGQYPFMGYFHEEMF